jgi:hypothetical protein
MLLNVEKQYMETFHPDKMALAKLVVLRTRAKFLKNNVLNLTGKKHSIYINAIRCMAKIEKILVKRLTNGNEIYHFDKGPGKGIKLTLKQKHFFNKEFKLINDQLRAFGLNNKLVNIYKQKVKVKLNGVNKNG